MHSLIKVIIKDINICSKFMKNKTKLVYNRCDQKLSNSNSFKILILSEFEFELNLFAINISHSELGSKRQKYLGRNQSSM